MRRLAEPCRSQDSPAEAFQVSGIRRLSAAAKRKLRKVCQNRGAGTEKGIRNALTGAHKLL